MRLLYGQDKLLCEWAGLKLLNDSEGFNLATAIGVCDKEKIIAAFIYNNYRTDINSKPHSIDLSVISIDKRWMNRQTVKAMFAYPFTHLNVSRLQALTSANAEGTNSIMKRLGFTQEGLHRFGYPNLDDAVSWAMLKTECRWI